VQNQKLIDNWGRPINYLRLAVTDRCNLRCFYCMPENGIRYTSKEQLLTYEEMLHLLEMFSQLGVDKLRITGGEPLVRKDLIPFLYKASKINGLRKMTMTTNGLLTKPFISDFVDMGMKSINLSLDSLDKNRFKKIARRDELDKVLATLEALKKSSLGVKINMVVMEQHNIDDIIPMAALSIEKNISVRFIEEMPFNGSSAHTTPLSWDYLRIVKLLKKEFDLNKIDDPENSTALHYKINGAEGNLGVIPAYSRTFCGSCNRLRLTAQGELRTCLYASKGLDLKKLIRSGCSEDQIKTKIIEKVNKRHRNGFDAEKERLSDYSWESMSSIGG